MPLPKGHSGLFGESESWWKAVIGDTINTALSRCCRRAKQWFREFHAENAGVPVPGGLITGTFPTPAPGAVAPHSGHGGKK
jgi:hypothetical protein